MKDGGEQRKKEALSESAVYDEWRKYVSLITITFCIVNTYVSRYPQMHEGKAKKTYSRILLSETPWDFYFTPFTIVTTYIACHLTY